MTPIERQFLMKAYEVDRQTRPKVSPGRPLARLSWRTIGVLCNLTGAQTDELVKRLAEDGQVEVFDPAKRLR